jgi:hypothetical protein
MRALILLESLKNEDVLADVTVVKRETLQVRNPARNQPPVWTALTVTADDSQADAVCEKLARTLRPRGWYVDGETKGAKFVVFPGRVFQYVPGDTLTKDAARTYGRSIGIPDSQLDWPD